MVVERIFRVEICSVWRTIYKSSSFGLQHVMTIIIININNTNMLHITMFFNKLFKLRQVYVVLFLAFIRLQ